VKYYLYISDTKVDMLLPQIPHKLQKQIATEFKLDLKIFSAARKTEETIDDDRIKRLEAVVAYIREKKRVGTAGRPAEYFAGMLAMRWGPLTERRRERYDPETKVFSPEPERLRDIVYFSGYSNECLIGLGGSGKHVIGGPGASNATDWGGSIGPVLLWILLKNTGISEKELPHVDPDLSSDGTIDSDNTRGIRLLRQSMRRTLENMSGPEQRVEFLAKRLVSGNSGGATKVILGTPIYVAMVG
jgi:hypothetical protein